jgi:hypothetical protein
MTLAIGALPFAPNILIDPLISSLFYLSFYSMAAAFEWRHDTQHNDNNLNGTCHRGFQNNNKNTKFRKSNKF